MKPNAEPIQTEISGLSHEGRGVTKINGKTVFIEGGLPEETVVFNYTQRKPRYDLGRAIKIIHPSKQRVQPLCIHFDQCGGCSLQHMNSDAQLDLKQTLLLDHLKHFAGVLPDQLLAPITGSSFHYRRRARLGVKYVEKKGKVLVGFREKTSHKIADLARCEILYSPVGERFGALQTLISDLEAYRSIPQIEIAVAEHVTAFVFRHLQPLSNRDEEKLTVFAKQHNLALYLQPGGLESIHLLWGPANQTLNYSLPEYNIEIQFQPFDFTQVNWDINPLMVRAALQGLALSAEDTVLDLFCGLGNFTLPMARTAKKVIGLEGSADLVKRAYQNAALNQITNVEFHAVDLAKPLPDKEWIVQEYDKILLDPPRTGALELIPLISKWNPSRIVYVSCNPATLARDIGVLVKQGQYKLTAAGIMDMFPQTMHVESMAVLERT